MSETLDRSCVGCGEPEGEVLLELCSVCGRTFCSNCAHRAGYGRRFCSAQCTRTYYFAGETDEDDQDGLADDD